jgi:hypothetical protein
VGRYKTFKVPTGEKKKTLFSETEVTREEKKWVQEGFSDCIIDGVLLSQELQQAVDQLNNSGFEVISITEIISGHYSWVIENKGQGGAGYGYGFSFTEGLIVLARKS